jgi:hypothetical protein
MAKKTKGDSYLLAENKTRTDFEAAGSKTAAKLTATPKHSWLVSLFGFVFMGLAAFDLFIWRRADAMESTLVFLGLLAFAVAYCLQNIEKRLAFIEQTQMTAGER